MKKKLCILVILIAVYANGYLNVFKSLKPYL